MIAVRFHGRGGQGTVIASKILAAALFRAGWQVQAFPSFGAERGGAPVAAFLRADRAPITAHYQVYEPDHVVVLDPVLLTRTDVTRGLIPGGTVLVNTPRPALTLGVPDLFHVVAIDATAIALSRGLGSRTLPIVNTAMAGAFAAATSLVPIDVLIDAVAELVPFNLDANLAAARDAFEQTRAAMEARMPTPV